MAQSYTLNNGVTVVDPGTYVEVNVQPTTSNSATAGVLTLVGEADSGPDWTQEADISQNFFTPTQLGQVQAKYGTGRLVDAFAKAISAANDRAISGAVSQVYLVKTNPSTPATSTIPRPGFGNYATLTADLAGAGGNLINYLSEPSTEEITPELPAFTYCPQYAGTLEFTLRTNGGPALIVSNPVRSDGPTFVASLNSIADGILATGGTTYAPLTGLGSGSITLSAAPVAGQPTQLLITLESGNVFNPAPTPGSSLVIVDSDYGTSHASCIKGTGGVNNAGAYLVLAVTNTNTSATILVQLINGESGFTLGSASGNIDTSADDILCFNEVTVQNITGQSRGSTIGISGLFTTTSNNGTAVVLSAPSPWTAQPQVGDYITFASTFAGINAGFYQVTGSTSTTVSFSILSNGSSGTTGTQNIVTAITVSTQPFKVLRQVIDGLGKSLEVAGNIESIAINPATGTGAGYSNSLQVSASEYSETMTIAKGNTNASYTSGGNIVIEVGCTQAGATMVVGPNSIAFKVGSNTIFTCTYAQFPTLATMASYINSQTSFSATVPSATYNNLPPSVLDEGTFGISSNATVDDQPGRIKMDAINWYNNINGNSLVSATLITFSGLPDTINPPVFLANGQKAGTTSAAFAAAISACDAVSTNIIVPLISQDATGDIALGQTDPTSTYTINGVNAFLLDDVEENSTVQARQPRIAIGSYLGTFQQCIQAAGQLDSFLFGLCCQSPITVSASGVSQTYQPWMQAVIAAGMQLAAGYKGIVKKFANISGFVNPAGFNSQNSGATSQALKAGLMVMEKVSSGGFRWISDQLTYSVDNNFVYNSLQAVYLTQLMTLSLIATFDNIVVGQSVAQISAQGALAVLASAMFNFRRLNWIAPSNGAPLGYTGQGANLVGGVMQIQVQVSLAGLIYFVPITFNVTEVQQSATG